MTRVDRRQSVPQGATTVTALYDGFDPVQEQSPTGTVSANLQIGLGVDERFTRTKAGSTSTYLTDLLGSTVALADSAGVVQTSYGYNPYGVTSQTGAANDNPYQFTGRQNDGTGNYGDMELRGHNTELPPPQTGCGDKYYVPLIAGRNSQRKVLCPRNSRRISFQWSKYGDLGYLSFWRAGAAMVGQNNLGPTAGGGRADSGSDRTD